MATQLAPSTLQRFFDNQGNPLSGGLVYTYQAGGVIPQATYTDSTESTANSNPVQLNARGEASIWFDTGLSYKINVTDSSGAQIPGWPVDNIPGGYLGISQLSLYITQAFIGQQLYPRTAAEIAASVTPTTYVYPPGNVLRYGADPTGASDSAPAIQAAINALNNWQTYSSSLGNKFTPGPDFTLGGEVYIPGGIYTISSTIMLAPNIRLRGATPIRGIGQNYSGAYQLVTVLRASSSFPALQYMVDSAIYRLKNESTGNPVTPYRVVSATDLFTRGNDLDNAYCNFMQSMTVQDMQLDGQNIAAGGVRIQGAAFFYVDGISIINTQYVGFNFNCCFEFSIGRVEAVAPAPLLMIGCESAMQDGGELQLYAETSASWTSGNQGTINAILNYNDILGPWYGLTLKVIQLQWCINVTFGYLSANGGQVGIELYHSNCNIVHWENEYTTGSPSALFMLRVSKCRCDGLTTKAGGALSTGDSNSKLVIREPGFIQCPISFAALNSETSSAFELQVYNYNFQEPDPILGVATTLSTVNISRWFPYTGAVNLYVDSSAGVSTVAGTYSASPTTIDGAFLFIANNPHIKEWIVNLVGGQTHTISSSHTLLDTNVQIAKISGTNPVLAINSSITLINSRLEVAFLSVTSNQTQMFLCQGVNNVEIASAAVTIAASSVIWASAANTTAKVVASGNGVTINFGTSSGLCSGGPTPSYVVYEDSFALTTITGTATLEAVTTGHVKKVVSNIV